MCTAMSIQAPSGNHYLGRTMDFSYPLDPELYIIPKGYSWSNMLRTHKIHTQYSVMGIGQDLSPVILSDGVNTAGFAAAALYFPGYAQYDDASQDSSKPAITATELVKFLLAQCASVKQAVSVTRTLRIVGVKVPVIESVAPLHWIIADNSGTCMVIEKTAAGLNFMDNPIGVLSNSPDFTWHMTNLRNYMNVAPAQRNESDWGPVNLTPFGQGAGTFGLPGDYTPPSRFVRAAFQKSHTSFPPGQEEEIVACFHTMETVSIPMGAVVTSRGAADYTQ